MRIHPFVTLAGFFVAEDLRYLSLSTDDWIDGKFVPKGTIVLINVWGLHQDPTYFPDPDDFEHPSYHVRQKIFIRVNKLTVNAISSVMMTPLKSPRHGEFWPHQTGP